jgi:xanthine dehydrogenase YagS FAD-binding subunit
MHIFEFIRPRDSAAAIAAAAQSKTAQQGAEMRFMGGGTTLIDLMKLNVETPTRLLDINRLPLGQIDNRPEGGLKIVERWFATRTWPTTAGAKTIRCCRRRF